MFKILRKSFETGIVTNDFPKAPAPISRFARGKPEIDFARMRNGEEAAKICPTQAITITNPADARSLALDLGKCIFCGLCAEASPAIRITNQCQLASTDRDALKITDILDSNDSNQTDYEALGGRARTVIQKMFGRSLHIREVDAGSCNGCEIEVVGLTSPIYDIERFGVHFVASPRHADMLLVTGPVTRNMELALRKTYAAMPAPRLVAAAGACACSGGIFGANYATVGGVDKILPVDVYIPGCPPNPTALLHGVLLAMGRLRSRRPSV